MLTPSKYWRVPCALTVDVLKPSEEFDLPVKLANQTAPPARGHGLTIAAYDEATQTGFLRWLGIIEGGTGTTRSVRWVPTEARIWVDTVPGRTFWKAGAFGFAPGKLASYGLHELWQDSFDGMELRSHVPVADRLAKQSEPVSRKRTSIAAERLNPVEVIGEPTSGQRAGVVYVLKSAYGYKVGRTRDVPSRMRTFGVQLPFIYTIPLCAWFDDCHQAEKRYHHIFADKRINGEWFDLTEHDVDLIRLRA